MGYYIIQVKEYKYSVPILRTQCGNIFSCLPAVTGPAKTGHVAQATLHHKTGYFNYLNIKDIIFFQQHAW